MREIVTEPCRLPNGKTILVVRDDLIPGGSKQAALEVVLPRLGYREFVFSSPVYGYAQVALALTCRSLGLKATIFCAQRRELHPLTRRAVEAGAKLVQVPAGRLNVVRARARQYCGITGALLFPMGFAIPEIETEITKRAEASGLRPTEFWSVAGSGALSRALQAAWPSARAFAVRIGFEPKAGAANVLVAPERFEEEAEERPPFPSCANYDAKAWRFLCRHASDNAVFWNVGR